MQDSGTLAFEVEKSADRVMIKKAIERIWGVKVEKVRTLKTPHKTGTYKKRWVRPSGKKAYVSLKPGYTIQLPGENMNAVQREDSRGPVSGGE